MTFLSVLVSGLAAGVNAASSTSYRPDTFLQIRASELTSSRTLIPMDGWAWKSPGCLAAIQGGGGVPGESMSPQETLGEMLTGRGTVGTPFWVQVGKSQTCSMVCEEELDGEKVNALLKLVQQQYVGSIELDDLPAATGRRADGLVTTFAVGVSEGTTAVAVNNFWKLRVEISRPRGKTSEFSIVGLQLEASSRKSCTETAEPAIVRTEIGAGRIPWLFEIEWVEQPGKTYKSRMNDYVGAAEKKMHWFSVFNSSVVALVLAAMVGGILVRVLNKDIAMYNRLAEGVPLQQVVGRRTDGSLEEGPFGDDGAETGWKLIHGDVFRAPPYRRWFCVLVGAGGQLFATFAVVLFMAAIGATGGQIDRLVQSSVVVYSVAGFLNGYLVARFLKLFGIQDVSFVASGAATAVPRRTVFLACVVFPGSFVLAVVLLDILLAAAGSSGTVPFSGLVALIVLWLGIHMPLTFIGASVGAREEVIPIPCRVNAIPRPLSSKRPWYSKSYILYGIGGILPFGAIFTELYYMLNAVVTHEYHAMFSLFAIIFLVYTITSALVSISLTYCTLIAEDYRWWFRSFVVCASSGLYVFLYGLLFFDSRMRVNKVVGGLVYLVYLGFMSLIVGLIAGFAGFITTFAFVRKIYGSVKVD